MLRSSRNLLLSQHWGQPDLKWKASQMLNAWSISIKICIT